jgi:hypothetical protein
MRFRYLALSVALAVVVTAGLFLGLHTGTTFVEAMVSSEAVASLEGDRAIRARETVSTAYLAVRFEDGDTIVRPVTFTGPISAYRALELSGLEFTTADHGWGLFVCSIEGVGDGSPACQNDDRFWWTASWNAVTGTWEGRMVGIADAMIRDDGHVEAFSWSDPDHTAVDPPPAPALTAAWEALKWLEGQQQADGSYGNPGSTAEVLVALGANHVNATVGDGTLATMWSQGHELDDTAAGAGKLALALTAQESCWPYGLLRPMAHYNDSTGALSADAAPHALAMLGTAALSETLPPSATDHLLDLQQPDGGWEWGVGWGTDTNATALAVQALVAAGQSPTATAVISGLEYLEGAQNDDGGFIYSPLWGGESDTNSTAYVLQALLAVGEDPLTGTWVIGDANPIEYLLNRQLPDGSFEYQTGGGANQMATQQAVPALLYAPFPVRTAVPVSCETVFLPLVLRE